MSDENYVDQGSMMDDYFDSNAELVYQDSDDEFSPAETPTNAENAETKKPTLDIPGQDDTETETTGEPESKEPVESVKAPDPFSFTEIGEDGNELFDPISAMDFIQRKTESKAEPQPGFQYERQPIDHNIAQQDEQPQTNYDDSVRQVYLAGFDYIDAYIQQGYAPHEAVQLAKQSANADLQNHLQERRLTEMEQRLLSKVESQKEKVAAINELESLRPASVRNLHEMAKEGGYKNIEHFQQALMTPGLGGDAIQYLFDRDNKGKTFKSNEEVAQAMEDWFVKFSADKTALKFLEEITRSRIALRNIPKIVESARKTAAKVSESNTKAKAIAPLSAQNKQRQNPSDRQPDLVAQYLGIDEV